LHANAARDGRPQPGRCHATHPSSSTRDGEIGNSGTGYKPGGYDKAEPKDRDDLDKKQPAIDGSRGSDKKMEASSEEVTDPGDGDDRGSKQRSEDEAAGRAFDRDSRTKLSKDWTGAKKS
jgi:hypothetical protein